MELTNKILQLAYNEKVYLYGGAVRDLLRNESPRDLDFLFFHISSCFDRGQFEQTIRSSGLTVIDYYATKYGFGKSLRLKVAESQEIQTPIIGVDLTINQESNCVCSKYGFRSFKETGKCECVSGARCFDFDVNQLIAQIGADGELCQIDLNPRFKRYVGSLGESANFQVDKIKQSFIRQLDIDDDLLGSDNNSNEGGAADSGERHFGKYMPQTPDSEENPERRASLAGEGSHSSDEE